MVTPRPRIIYCTPQRSKHGVVMGDPGSFWIDKPNKVFYLKTPAGLASINLNRLQRPHWDWNGNALNPSIVPSIKLSHVRPDGKEIVSWHGFVTDGKLIPVLT